MPTYQFYLDAFKITNTRSFHNDTLIVGLGLQVNGTLISSIAHQMGDFDNGTHLFWQQKVASIDEVTINPADELVFMYQIYNNGHDHQPSENLMRGTIEQDLAKAMGQYQVKHQAEMKKTNRLPTVLGDENTGAIADGDVDADPQLDADGSGGDPPVQENFFTGGLYALFSFLFKSCDGPVALGMFATTGAGLEAKIAAAGGQGVTFSQTFDGKKLKYGAPCNASGSDYVVTWIAQHH